MNATTIDTSQAPGAVPRSIGLHGRVTVLSAMAGGVGLGGILVGLMTLGGRLSGHALFLNATALFAVGAVLGLAHGAVLGFLGRPAGTTVRRALGDLGRAALYAVPALAVAWLAAIWVSMSLIAVYTGRFGPLVGVGLGWVAAGVIVAVALVQGVRALRNAYQRWPERRPGTVLVGGIFAALLVMFLADRPELWGSRIRLTETGAVLLAAVATIWVAGPLVTVALRLARQIPMPRPLAGLEGTRSPATDLGIGLMTGLVVGLLAVPFAAPTAATASAGAVVVGVGQALVNEVLLRLFLVTGAAWLILRLGSVKPNVAFAVAVIIAAAVQVGLYAPGAVSVGYATWTGTAGFLLAAVAIPATAFGILYWRRGFASALVADAVALATVLLLIS